MPISLPKFVVLKSKYNGKYLEYLDEEGPLHGFLRFTGEDVASPYVKFQVERAESDEHLVHIKCCYNNMYWGRSTDANHWIHCVSDERVEDPSKWSCTLFHPNAADADHGFRFKHVNTGHYAILMRQESLLTDNCLNAAWSEPNEELCDVCTVIDWDSLVILPKYVVFKGDNDKYLSATLEGDNYLQFQALDNKDPNAVHEVFLNPDGSIRFKSIHLGKFWRRGPDNWILADSDDTSNNDIDTLFSLVEIEDNFIALSNLGNNNFCQRLTTDAKTDCLNAAASSIINGAQLEFSEPIIRAILFEA